MNNEGWGLRIMLLFIAFAGAVIVVCFKSLSNIIMKDFSVLASSKNSSTYQNTYILLEENIAKAASRYIKEFEIKEIIQIEELIERKYIDRVIDLKETNKLCTGYVVFKKENNQQNYKTHLNCPNYKT